MKKYFVLLGVFLLFSCDMIMKKSSDTQVEQTQEMSVGTDVDTNGCVASAGYSWSIVLNKCIRPFEEGIRLNPIKQENENDAIISSFLVFDEEGSRVEVFMPESSNNIILDKVSDKLYQKDSWKLDLNKIYILMKNKDTLYVSAVAIDRPTIGSDVEEE